jgi:hypothetical protein
MYGQVFEVPNSAPRAGELDQLEARVQGRLNGQVRDLRLLQRHGGLVLQGLARTYYVKQMAQHVVMEATRLPIVANEIEVQ